MKQTFESIEDLQNQLNDATALRDDAQRTVNELQKKILDRKHAQNLVNIADLKIVPGKLYALFAKSTLHNSILRYIQVLSTHFEQEYTTCIMATTYHYEGDEYSLNSNKTMITVEDWIRFKDEYDIIVLDQDDAVFLMCNMMNLQINASNLNEYKLALVTGEWQ